MTQHLLNAQSIKTQSCIYFTEKFKVTIFTAEH